MDSVEKEADKGRNLVKMRQKNGKLIRFLLNSQGEADDLCTSVQLCGMIKFTDTHPFYYNPPRKYEELKKPNVLGTQVKFHLSARRKSFFLGLVCFAEKQALAPFRKESEI